ncbi:hypothetical protein O181_131265 [Austropuccinia psidii MF-1]|uniref:Uncharacterized protein n=1 Tax=Austropuccinia psidii MF-1 TaxID=1389203 RepID=A0A9Q3L556_9BASI|nr:hypothetical protein [Austropuccinia psidii MF-1]
MEESSSSKKALTLEEELEKEQSRIEELGQEESEEEDFSYLENDEKFQKKMLELQKAMESAGRRHGKKTKSSQFSPETSGGVNIERMLRPQKPSPSPTPKTLATSTPGTFPRAERFAKRVNITTPTQQPERATIPTRKIVKIKAKGYNLNFDESDVEDFIKHAERIASIEGANESDLAMQIAFWSEDKDIRYEIEGMTGYEMEDWDQLKKEMISKWENVEPERRHREDSSTRLLNQTQQEGGVKSLSQYRNFIGKYDIISKYLLKYGYIKKENYYYEDVFNSSLPEVRSSVTKEIIKDRTMVQARDGGYILPEMNILRNYIEAELEAAVIIKGKSQLL